VFASLQPLPEIAMRVMRIANSEASFVQLSDLIRSDAAFSAEILRMANSASIGCRARIQSVQHALTMLGMERLKTVAITVALRKFLAARLRVPVLRRCWRHSIASAIIAEQIGAACRWKRETNYTAGLLHDVGRLGLLATFPVEYAALMEEAAAGEMDVREGERRVFGADHCEAGLVLADMYRFPEELKYIAGHHHDAPPEEFNVPASIQLACRLADTLGFAAAGTTCAPSLEDLQREYPGCAWDALPGKPDPLKELLRKVKLMEASF
jgi:putative nucleotidyltransferase with HDIG domain